jgi:predicted nucleic acid-binding Zn ribbon protein
LSRADRIANAGRRTAKDAREAASKRRQSEKRKISNKSMDIRPHRHCVVCWRPISLESEPAVCDDEECIENNKKRESSRKRLTIMLYLFPGIAILLIFLQLMSGGA